MAALSLKIDPIFNSFFKLSIIYGGPTPLWHTEGRISQIINENSKLLNHK